MTRAEQLLRSIDVSGPDADGLSWLYVRRPYGDCCFSTKSTCVAGVVLAKWKRERDEALAEGGE